MKYTTEAWVLNQSKDTPLSIESITFSELSPEEVLIKPMYGCFEGNMLHALERTPINICTERNEKKIVLGNAGVVEVQEIGSKVDNVKKGQYCIYFCNGESDDYGFPEKIAGYDCVGSIGLLAKLTKAKQSQLIPIPEDTKISLQQWAAFSLRYITAWSNWKVAYSCFLSQMDSVKPNEINVVAWGGGVSLAELSLANHFGCNTFMVSSKKDTLETIKRSNIHPIDRTQFSKGNFESEFLAYLDDITNKKRASIFVDNIGGSLFNLTLKSLSRQGVLATSGWKNGAVTPFVRSLECIHRHIFVHTHYAKYEEGVKAVDFAYKNHWVPELSSTEYTWKELPKLIEDYQTGNIDTYFPIFSVN